MSEVLLKKVKFLKRDSFTNPLYKFHRQTWKVGEVTLLEHAAYLGKELYKAELALQYGKKYRQDLPLEFPKLAKAVLLLKQS